MPSNIPSCITLKSDRSNIDYLFFIFLSRTLQHIQKSRISGTCTCIIPQHVTYLFPSSFIYFSTFFCICRGLSHFFMSMSIDYLLFYFILFVFFSKATDQTSNQREQILTVSFCPTT